MNIILKIAAGVLIAMILLNTIPKQSREIAIILMVAVCCMVYTAAANYLQPVFAFMQQLQTQGALNGSLFEILINAVAIGLVSELIGLICKDMGNTAISKSLQFFSSAAILYVSLPLFQELLTLLESVLEGI